MDAPYDDVVSSSAVTAPVATGRSLWKQDVFAVSGWVDPQVPVSELDERYAEMRAANFTVMLGFDGNPKLFPANPERVSAQIGACERQDLRCMPNACQGDACIGLGRNSSALWGWQLHDEPGSGQFPWLAERAANVTAANPRAASFVNLFPSYANRWHYWPGANPFGRL